MDEIANAIHMLNNDSMIALTKAIEKIAMALEHIAEAIEEHDNGT